MTGHTEDLTRESGLLGPPVRQDDEGRGEPAKRSASVLGSLEAERSLTPTEAANLISRRLLTIQRTLWFIAAVAAAAAIKYLLA